MLLVDGVLVRWSGKALLTRRRGDLTPEAQHFEDEQSNPVRAFAQLRCLGVGLMTVSHSNLVSLIRIPSPSTHPSEPYWRTDRPVERAGLPRIRSGDVVSRFPGAGQVEIRSVSTR